MASRTRRSDFLSEALLCYETGDSQRLFDLANELWMDADNDVHPNTDDRILKDMFSKMRESYGEILESQRLSLAARHNPDITGIILEHLEKLSAPTRDMILLTCREALSRPPERDEAADRAHALEALDARYARELIELLPRVVAKATLLQEVEIARIPKASVQRYFHEAHRCYFFGLNRACVVLCRAMLEAALKEIIGPDHRLHELLELAGSSGTSGKPILDPERLCVAERIFSAGNSAVHQEHIFAKNYSDQEVEEILLDTRKVLEDIYS